MGERNKSLPEQMRDELEAIGSLQATADNPVKKVLMLPLRAIVKSRARAMGFSDTEIDALTKVGSRRPVEETYKKLKE